MSIFMRKRRNKLKATIKLFIALSLFLSFLGYAVSPKSVSIGDAKISAHETEDNIKLFDKYVYLAENLFVICPVPSSSAQVQNRLKTAFDFYYPKALKGDPDAQNKIGVAYFFGLGVEVDFNSGKEWLTKSADQNNPEAQVNLANAYIISPDNLSREQVRKIAFKLFEKAAQRGNARGQLYLASSYYLGRGVNKDTKKALFWEEKAASQQNAEAVSALGEFYFDGVAVARNYRKSFDLFSKALSIGDMTPLMKVRTIRAIEYMYRNGLGIQKDERKADYWKTKAMEYKLSLQKCIKSKPQDEIAKGKIPAGVRAVGLY